VAGVEGTLCRAVRKPAARALRTLLEGSDVCFAPVPSMAEAAVHPHTWRVRSTRPAAPFKRLVCRAISR
jgi:hypothetical protein